jgi:hypothetical protein
MASLTPTTILVADGPGIWPSAHTSAVGTSVISRSDGSCQQHNLVHFVQVQQIKLKFPLTAQKFLFVYFVQQVPQSVA